MTKLITIPTKQNLSNIVEYSDAILIGIDNLSVNVPGTYSIHEVEEIIKKYNQIEFFVALNKNMHKCDLDNLKDALIKLDKMNIAGIFYYDIAVLEYRNTLNLKVPLVWSQEHLTTNYATMNYWYNENVNYTYVSSEITLDEIIENRKNTKMKLIVPIFGYLPMFVSKRHLVENYLEYFNLDKKSSKYELEKDSKLYPVSIISNDTTIYSSHILNGLSELKVLEENNIEYVTLNSYNIDTSKFIDVLKIYKSRLYESEKEIDMVFDNLDKGFLYKETVYRVKKNEKK